jgi:hypothetical protein
MEFTEKEQKQLAATPWLNENQKQAVSLLRSLSEEEVAEVIEWTLPILACVTFTCDVKRQLQAQGVAIDDNNVAFVVEKLNERMGIANMGPQMIQSAIEELKLELQLEQAEATKP